MILTIIKPGHQTEAVGDLHVVDGKHGRLDHAVPPPLILQQHLVCEHLQELGSMRRGGGRAELIVANTQQMTHPFDHVFGVGAHRP